MPRPITEGPKGGAVWHNWGDIADKLQVAADAASEAEQAIGALARRHGVRYVARCLRVSHTTVLRWANEGQLASQRIASLIRWADDTASNFGTPPGR